MQYGSPCFCPEDTIILESVDDKYVRDMLRHNLHIFEKRKMAIPFDMPSSIPFSILFSIPCSALFSILFSFQVSTWFGKLFAFLLAVLFAL